MNPIDVTASAGRRFAQAAALLVTLGTLLVLGGYALHVAAVIVVREGFQGMSPLTALALLLLAVSIYFRQKRLRQRIAAGSSLAIGMVVLTSYVATGDDIVSELISLHVFRYDLQQSGIMSIATAVCVASLGVAVLMRSTPRIADPAAAIAVSLAGFALLGYAYGVRDLYDVPLFRTMALHTAFSIFALGAAVLTMRPRTGWSAIATAPTASGTATRRLLGFTLVPPIAGWVLLRKMQDHQLGPGASMAILVVITVVPLALLILKNGRAAAALEREQRATAAVQRAGDLELRQIADALPVLIAFVDRDYTYRFANKTYEDWFGEPAERVIGRRVPELLSTGSFEDRRPFLEAALAGRESRFELTWPHLDGREREAEIRYIPRFRAEGSVDGFHVFVADVTDRKRLERELQNRAAALEVNVEQRTRDLRISEAKASLYFQSTDEYLFLVEVGAAGDVRFSDINPAAEKVIGGTASGVVGLLVGDVLPEGVAADIERHARRCSESGESQTYEARGRYSRGDAIVVDAVVALLQRNADGGSLVLFSGRDITERLSIEEQLRQAQKMEAVGQLTGGIAHDFNNLLTAISGSLEMMEVRVRQGRLPDVEKYIATAQGASRRAAALTHRLLAFSRRQTLDPVATDVAKLVVGMADLIRRTVGPEITVETVNMTGLWNARVDPSQLENALLNLCINARDAMPDGGRLTIETANRWMDDRAARDRDLAPGQYLSLCVSDTGTGMAPEVVARAFDPFFTTKPLGLGTGLGLSMIYGFARQSGGQVRIYSEAGSGTMVCIYLPRHYGDEEAAEDPVHDGALPHLARGETVLVVDDEAAVRMLVQDVLTEMGYAAMEAADGPSGLTILRTGSRIDLLITDVGLPGGMNGRQVADAARAIRPGLKVLFITGYAENAAVGNGQLEPGMAVLTKPFAMGDLTSKIQGLIGAG